MTVETTETTGAEPSRPGRPPAGEWPPRRGRRRAIAAGIVLVIAGAGVAVALVRNAGGGAGVVLLPAAESRESDLFGDLDLMPADERADAIDGIEDPAPRRRDLDDPAALAGLRVRGTAAQLYAATTDEPTCDLQALLDAVEGDDGELGVWADVVAGDRDGARPAAGEADPAEVVGQLTPVRLRFDTRVTAFDVRGSRLDRYPAVLQAGTAVLIDARGMPRVRCSGGLPLDEPETADGLDGEAAFDVGAQAADPDQAWGGFDPREVVVVQPGRVSREFELADLTGGRRFTRPIGTNGERDWREPTGATQTRCEDCPDLVVTAETVTGTPARLEALEGGIPTSTAPGELKWAGADPDTYRWTIVHETVLVRSYTGRDGDVPPRTGVVDDPRYEGDDTAILPAEPGAPFLYEVWQCLPGDITVTVRVDGAVVDTTTHTVACGAGAEATGEFTLGP